MPRRPADEKVCAAASLSRTAQGRCTEPRRCSSKAARSARGDAASGRRKSLRGGKSIAHGGKVATPSRGAVQVKRQGRRGVTRRPADGKVCAAASLSHTAARSLHRAAALFKQSGKVGAECRTARKSLNRHITQTGAEALRRPFFCLHPRLKKNFFISPARKNEHKRDFARFSKLWRR